MVCAASEGVRRKVWSRAPTKPCELTQAGASARGCKRRNPRRASVGRTRSQSGAGETGTCGTKRVSEQGMYARFCSMSFVTLCVFMSEL